MVSRTNTTSQLIFSYPLPSAVTYDFTYATAESNPYIRVIVPTGSNWSLPIHWSEKHTEHLACEAGVLHLYEARSLYHVANRIVGPGYEFDFYPDTQYSWRRSDYGEKDGHIRKEDLITHVSTEPDYAVRHELFYRNINSAILDAAKYPHLRSTPVWIRLLLSWLSEETQTAWTNRIFRLQIMVMYQKFDFWPYLGSIPLDTFWTWRPFSDQAPPWVSKFVWRSMHVISHVKVSTGAWFGRWFLGLRPTYPEYTPERLHSSLKMAFEGRKDL